MRAILKLLCLAAVMAMLAALFSCTREITVVEENSAFPQNCWACHTDQDMMLVTAEQQWRNSKHASGNNTNRNSASCSGCHTSEGFWARIGGQPTSTINNPGTIHCFTCHAPHTTGTLGLRVEDPLPLQDGFVFDVGLGNLCVACHQSRQDVNSYVITSNDSTNIGSHWGPHHSVQGDMLLGSNGYEYPAFGTYPITEHRTITEDGCVDCHMRGTRNLVVGGHTWAQRNILEEAFGDGEEEILNTAACRPCHGTIPDFNYKRVQTTTDSLMEHLGDALFTAGLIDSGGHPITGQWVSNDEAGALWNFLMAEEDRSKGVHNRDYIQSLLKSAIQYMEGTLPVP